MHRVLKNQLTASALLNINRIHNYLNELQGGSICSMLLKNQSTLHQPYKNMSYD